MLLIFPLLASPLTDHFTCTQAGTMPGPEDFAVLSSNTLLVSSDPRRTPDQSGQILLLDLPQNQETSLPIANRDSCSFHPHGIFYQAQTQELYVVTHYQDTESPGCALKRDGKHVLQDGVERFRYENGQLSFLERLQDPLLREPNDLVVTDTGELFVSDNPEFTTFGMLTALSFGRRPSTLLSHSAEGGWAVAAKRFLYSNGVLLTDTGWLWVATYGGHLWGYRLDEAGNWVRRGHSRVQGALDNLMVGEDGQLYVAAHPDPFAFLRHAKDPNEVGPSLVYRMAPLDDGWGLMASWLDESGLVQASSTATLLDGRLLIAQVFAPGIVVCVPR